MQFQIQVLALSVTTKTGKTGKPYQNAEFTYKDLTQAKVVSKNITGFSKVFNTVAEAKTGETYDIVAEKVGEYWEWQSMARNLTPSASPTETIQGGTYQGKAQAAPRSNYETPEERAKRQVYIVRQSSISAAVAVLSLGAKAPPKREDVVELARYFTDFVFDADNPATGKDLFDLPNDIEVS